VLDSATAAAGLTDRALALWEECPGSFPDCLPRFTPREQAVRERRLDVALAAIEKDMAGVEPGADAEIGRITRWLAQLSACALDLEDDAETAPFLQDGLGRISAELAGQARALDPDIDSADILQAARNAWTACALQHLLGRRMTLTPSIFAYSMLYPYTDNYLDDPNVPRYEKEQFGARFGQRLAGVPVTPRAARETIIWKLAATIEAEYPRHRFPQVYDSLLEIHEAQQASVRQMRSTPADGLDLARATLWKGGASVLADAYLAAGTLTPSEAGAAFTWGIALQLNDDLQDFHADRARASATLFTQAAEHGNMDLMTNRVFHFSQAAAARVSQLPGAGPGMNRMIAGSSQLLMIRSAAHAAECYSAEYLERLEASSPFRLEFLRNRERRLSRHSERYQNLWRALA
jgi:hypothetical protein